MKLVGELRKEPSHCFSGTIGKRDTIEKTHKHLKPMKPWDRSGPGLAQLSGAGFWVEPCSRTAGRGHHPPLPVPRGGASARVSLHRECAPGVLRGLKPVSRALCLEGFPVRRGPWVGADMPVLGPGPSQVASADCTCPRLV